MSANVTEVRQFLDVVAERLSKLEVDRVQRERIAANRFNVFDLIEPDENKLSDIVADLINPSGSHGQGEIFLQLLFKRIGLKASPTARVQREAPTHGIAKFRRRIDIFIDSESIVAIENKAGSTEQAEQVKHYLEHLEYCVRGSSRMFALIYLTPSGCAPTSLDADAFLNASQRRQLHCWAYRGELQTWLMSCRDACHAQKIQYFLSDFITFIERTMPSPESLSK